MIRLKLAYFMTIISDLESQEGVFHCMPCGGKLIILINYIAIRINRGHVTSTQRSTTSTL